LGEVIASNHVARTPLGAAGAAQMGPRIAASAAEISCKLSHNVDHAPPPMKRQAYYLRLQLTFDGY
jgi:hypothetical protein